MIAHDIVTLIAATCVQSSGLEREISGVYTSDLLSDVMAHAAEGSVLVTIQAHRNAVAVASLAGVRAIIICNDRPIPADMVTAAEQENMPIFRTSMNQYSVSGRLYTVFNAQDG